MIKELVCITCPSGCHLQAVLDEQNNVLSVSGNRCPRGETYARSELIAPRRMLTSTVRIEGALHPLLPVATSAPILKSRIFLVMEEIRKIQVSAPVICGSILVENIGGSNADLVATKTMERIQSNEK